MYSEMNKKYEVLCARNDVNVTIHTMTDEEGIRHHAAWHEKLDRPADLLYFYRDRE